MPATGHTHQLKKVDAVQASCLFEGNIDYYVCDFLSIDPSGATVDSGCGLMFSDAEGENRIDTGDELLPATGHSMGGWNHWEDYHERWCSFCNYSESAPHVFSPYAENGATETDCQMICLTCTYSYTLDA